MSFVITTMFIAIIINTSSIYYTGFKKKEEKVLAAVFLMLFYLGVTKTNDSNMYKQIFYDLKNVPDLGWLFITNFTKMINGNHILNIWIYYLLTVYFCIKIINKFSYNPLFVIFNLQIFTMFLITNQIRYYLGLYIFIFSIILFEEKKIFLSFIYSILSLFFHKSIIVLYASYFLILFINIKSLKDLIKKNLIISIGLYVSFNMLGVVTKNINFLNHYTNYLKNERHITFKGWIFNIIFIIIWYIYIYILNNQIFKNRSMPPKVRILLKLIFMGIIFIPISIKSLDFLYRYTLAFHIVNLLYITHIIIYLTKKQRVKILIFTLILSLTNYIYFFELPLYLNMKTQKGDLIKIYEGFNLMNISERLKAGIKSKL